MKSKITLVLTLVLSIISQLQAQTDTKTYHDQMKVLMSQLDSTRFKNNTLYDRVYPLANLKQFNQNGRKDTSNYKHFYQAIYELHLAGNKQNIYSANHLRQLGASAKLNGEVLVGIINMDITTLKEDVFDENNSKMLIDSTGQDRKMVEIVDKEPYQTLQTLVI